MVTLEDITAKNFQDFMDMELPEHQRDFLASNAYSIAQAKYYEDYIPRGIYHDGKPAGFLLYDKRSNNNDGEYGIYRFMVDYPQQGKGIGRRAMELLPAELKPSRTSSSSPSATSRTTPAPKPFTAALASKKPALMKSAK